MKTEGMSLEEILNIAVEIADPTARAAFLDSVCGSNEELRADIGALLKAHDEAGDFLEVPVLDAEVTLNSPLTEAPGTIIGRYKLLEKIGEGGMACVYMAEQVKPLRRKVALKIIKLGMDTKRVIARFEAERQALAMMNHANIARALDAGATETGRPFFVMELVRGISITEYCDKNKLSTRERLDLFIQVCNAVQHAHQKGIIHRDIKPSNVMVTLHDGKPVPKVIDFGIAKATSQRLTEKTLFTRYAQMIGTPEYMSPEQAEMSGLDIDTRTDIYSLGILLYELLTGTTPFDTDKLREAGYAEMQRIICEQEPAKPSTKLSTMGQALSEVAEHRKTNPDLLSKLIRGDLDWIVMKSLEKDRIRRYDTAAELTADIERHLNSEPVQAAAPSVLYRLNKFVRRNRTFVAGTAVVTVVLAVAIVVVTTLIFQKAQVKAAADLVKIELAIIGEKEKTAVAESAAAREKERAAVAESAAARTALETMRGEAERQEKVFDAVTGFFKGEDLSGLRHAFRLRGKEVPLRLLLGTWESVLDEKYEGDPLVEALLRELLAMMFWSFDYEITERNLKAVYEIRREKLDQEHPHTLRCVTSLIELYEAWDKPQQAEQWRIKLLREESEKQDDFDSR